MTAAKHLMSAAGFALLALLASAPQADPWTLFGDARLRGDWVRGIPGRSGVDRGRASLRLGVTWTPASRLELGGAGKGTLGTDSDNPNRADNELPDTLCVDQAFVRFFPWRSAALAVGQTELPLWLGPLVWDDDLRPIGVSWSQRVSLRDFDVVRICGGWFAPNPVYRGQTRLGAGQVSYLWREGAPKGGEFILSYLEFHDLESLAKHGLGRGNRLAAYEDRFRLLDAQLALRSAFGPLPVELRFDAAHRFAAIGDNEALRASLRLGDVLGPHRAELGYVFQRLERDAVLAAFTSDDWWFHTWSRGQMLWASLRLAPGLTLQTRLFFERREDLPLTKRLLLDLHWRLRA